MILRFKRGKKHSILILFTKYAKRDVPFNFALIMLIILLSEKPRKIINFIIKFSENSPFVPEEKEKEQNFTRARQRERAKKGRG